MKKILVVLAVLAVAGSAWADTVNVPSGVTGLWRFQTTTPGGHDATMAATVGSDLINSAPESANPSNYNGYWLSGPWTDIGVEAWHTMFSDGGVSQERSYDYLTCPHGIAPGTGGGSYVNSYTIMMDYVQTNEVALWNGNYYNSLYQTNTSNSNDGDLFIKGPSRSASVIGNGDTGYSTSTFDASTWHRIAISVDNSSFFRVYIDGTLYLDAAGQGVDGRFSLDPTVLLFADNDWEDAWGLVGTVATWNRALSTAEIAPMGGWLNGAATPTPLIIPEPATISLLVIAGLAFCFVWKKNRK
jgi:hypothetical protein